jgi:hypothetical protein
MSASPARCVPRAHARSLVPPAVAWPLHFLEENRPLSCKSDRPRDVSTMNVSEGNSVIEKLGFLVRFWELRARHATLGQPLAPQEQLELLSLMQLVTSDFKMPEPGAAPRTHGALPAQLIGEGRILPVEIRSVSAAALLVATLTAISAGERVILRAADAVSGIEYALPGNVAWVHEGSPCTLAIVVDGIPTRSDFGAPAADAHVRSSMALGRHHRLVG